MNLAKNSLWNMRASALSKTQGFVVFRTSLIASLIFFLLFPGAWSYYKIAPGDRYVIEKAIQARSLIFMNTELVPNPRGLDKIRMRYRTDTGQDLLVEPANFEKQVSATAFAYLKKTLQTGLLISFALWLTLGGGSLFFFLRRKNRKTEAKKSGADTAISAKKLNRLLKKAGVLSDLRVGGAAIPKGTEVGHMLFLGAPRAGKSTAIKHLIRQVEKRKEKRIIFDPTGEFKDAFFQDGRDSELNPLSKSAEKWDLFKDSASDIHLGILGEAFFPEKLGVSDPFWVLTARSVFKHTLAECAKKKSPSLEKLVEALLMWDAPKIYKLLKDTPAARFLGGEDSKETRGMITSILASLTTKTESLKYLQKEADFAISDWINNEEQGDKTLFITGNTAQMTLSKPLILAWLDIAISSVMSLEPDPKRRIWFFLDEIARLGHLPRLEMAMSQAPKYGACFVVGAQSIGQFDSNFGREAKTMLDCFASQFFFRINSAETAKWVSASAGRTEDPSNPEKDKARLPHTKLLDLPPFEAYLQPAGHWPLAKIKVRNFVKKPKK